MTPIDPAGLLRHAHSLVEKPVFVFTGVPPSDEMIARFTEALPERTGEDFRRAVSAAYYAAFHAVTLACADHVAPGSSGDDRGALARMINHRDLRTVAGWVSGDRPPEHVAGIVAALRSEGAADGASAVVRVAETIKRLVDAREEADYNHRAPFDRDEARMHVRDAGEAVDLVEAPAFADSAGGRQFLGLLALRARGGGS